MKSLSQNLEEKEQAHKHGVKVTLAFYNCIFQKQKEKQLIGPTFIEMLP